MQTTRLKSENKLPSNQLGTHRPHDVLNVQSQSEVTKSVLFPKFVKILRTFVRTRPVYGPALYARPVYGIALYTRPVYGPGL